MMRARGKSSEISPSRGHELGLNLPGTVAERALRLEQAGLRQRDIADEGNRGGDEKADDEIHHVEAPEPSCYRTSHE